MLSNDLDVQIEEYLEGRMDAPRKAQFEERLQTDAELRHRVLGKIITRPFFGTVLDYREQFSGAAGLALWVVIVEKGEPGEIVITVPTKTKDKQIAAGLAAVDDVMPALCVARVERRAG